LKNYFEVKRLSSSFIKHFIKKGEPTKEEGRNLVIGSIVDLILTENNEDCYFLDEELSFPTGLLKTFIDSLFNQIKNKEDKNPTEEDFKEAYEKSKAKQKDLNFYIDIFNTDKDIIKYWNFKIDIEKNRHKPIVTTEEEIQIKKCVKDIRDYGKYFNESFCQLEIYTDNFKIKPDLVYIKDGQIHIKDLKTLEGYTENAVFNMSRFRYDIQAYFYHYVMKEILRTKKFECNNKEFKKLILENDFTLNDYFDFIFVSKNKESNVMEFKMKIEPVKTILDREYQTKNDVENGIYKYLYCLEKRVEPNLTNYYLVNDNIVWM